jgi:hypothetical protein
VSLALAGAALPDRRAFGRAWVTLSLALTAHVADEALTDFLAVYNPIVRSARERFGWWPMPTFTFEVWLAGLIVVVALLLLLKPLAYGGARLVRLAGYPFAGIMLLNGLGHLAGSVYFGSWMPGVTTAPILIAASIWLLVTLRANGLSARAGPSADHAAT